MAKILFKNQAKKCLQKNALKESLKKRYREFLKSQLKNRFNILDIRCAREILALILRYKVPKSYKYYNKICYKQNADSWKYNEKINKENSEKYNKKRWWGKNEAVRYRQNYRGIKNVLLYLALDSEVRLIYIFRTLLKRKNYNIFVPKIKNNNLKIVKYALPLRKNRFNIKEPISSKIYNNLTINIAIIPVLGVDRDMKRIGFGKGMYDRFYASLNIKPYSIFVSRILHISQESLCQWHDIAGQCYKGVYTGSSLYI